MNKVLKRKFFSRPTIRVARGILGKFLVRKAGNLTISRMITEVEAYMGPSDKASHASRGLTERTKVMFGDAGYWYVYLVYGMHYCLNVVTGSKNYPAALLIRSVDGVNGPGRVCRLFGIDKKFNAKNLSHKTGLWIENRGIAIKPAAIHSGKRIGVDYAGKWKSKPWRFFI